MISWVSAEGIGTGTLRQSFHEQKLVPPKPWSESEIQVRAYAPGDRRAIRKICCDTGFLGRPIDAVFQDRELFADLFTGPYLNHEPGWALVAEAEGRVIGYLLGSVRQDFDFVLMRNGFPVASKMLYNLLTRKYSRHPRSARFVRWLLTRGYHEQPKHPEHAAHLHMDIAGPYRGRGVGRRLWDIFEARLDGAGMKHCYGAFFSYPGRRPESVYARYGFTVFDRTRTTLFQPEVPEVDVVCVHRSL